MSQEIGVEGVVEVTPVTDVTAQGQGLAAPASESVGLGIANIGQLPWMQVCLIVGTLLMLFYLIRLQRSRPDFNLIDLVIGDDDKISLAKFGQAWALLVSTWGFIYLVVTSNLTEWYYAVYMVAWTGSNLINKWLTTRELPYQGAPPDYRGTPYHTHPRRDPCPPEDMYPPIDPTKYER